MRYSIPYVVRSTGSPGMPAVAIMPMSKDDALFWKLRRKRIDDDAASEVSSTATPSNR